MGDWMGKILGVTGADHKAQHVSPTRGPETKTRLQGGHDKVVITAGSHRKVFIQPFETKVGLRDAY